MGDKTKIEWTDSSWNPIRGCSVVSVENQKTADERIPFLLQTPATVRWISAEPLLGPVNLRPAWLYDSFPKHISASGRAYGHQSRLHWLVAGGESGPNARPMHPDWARSLRAQCVAAGVAFFFKQFGEWAPRTWSEVIELPPPDGSSRLGCFKSDGEFTIGSSGSNLQNMARVGKKTAGRVLDGRTWDEMPKVMSHAG